MPTGDTSEPDFGVTIRGATAEQKLFGRFTLKKVLGRGGMGIVWLAQDEELQRKVAMKFLPDMIIRDREAVEDLKRETRRSLDLTHHHIVRIYDFTQDETSAAIVMEYVDGETLSAMKTQQPGGCFAVSVLAPWIGHFCAALEYAHRQARVVHRDLKPANLMVNSRGELKITDFGISRSMSDSMTRVSMSNTAGTLAYMSPEQALGAPPAALDDVYAFGATVYDLLTGRPPFFRGNLQVQLETVVPPPMMQRREELGHEGEPIPALWEEVIAMCLAKRPQDRPQSMGDVAAMLGLGGPSTGYRPGMAPGHVPASGGAPTTATTNGAPPSTRATVSPEQQDTAKDTTPGTARPPTTGTRRAAAVVTSIDEVLPGFSREESAPAAPPEPAVESAPLVAEKAAAVEPPEIVLKTPLVEQPAPPAQPSAPEPDYEGVTLRGVAPQEAAPAAAPPPPPEPRKSVPPPAFAPHLATSPATPASKPAPIASPATRRRSPMLAIIVVAAVLAIGLGNWMGMQPGDKSPAGGSTAQAEPTPPVVEPPPPPPTYERESQAVRQLIAAGRLDDAANALAAIPATAAVRPELDQLLAAEKAQATAMTEKNAKINGLLAAADTAVGKRSWAEARKILGEINTLEPNSAAASQRLALVTQGEAAEQAARKAEDEKRMAAAAEQERQAQMQREVEAKAKADADAAEKRREKQMAEQREQEERDRQRRLAAQREKEAEERARQKAAAPKRTTPRPQPVVVVPPRPISTPRPAVIVQPPPPEKKPKVFQGAPGG
jgi:serine/threonine protein kinase